MRALADLPSLNLFKISVEYHVSFLFRDLGVKKEANKLFFFGRTARSRQIPLKEDPKVGGYSSTEEEHMYFHSSLEKLPNAADAVFLVLEVVINVDPDSSKKDEKLQKRVVSGGFIYEKLFQFSKTYNKPTIMKLMKGSPRELAATIDDDS
jgi:hypothetical protein